MYNYLFFDRGKLRKRTNTIIMDVVYRIHGRMTYHESRAFRDIVTNKHNFSYFKRHQQLSDLRLLQDEGFYDPAHKKMVKETLEKLKYKSDRENDEENERYAIETFIEIDDVDDLFGYNFRQKQFKHLRRNYINKKRNKFKNKKNDVIQSKKSRILPGCFASVVCRRTQRFIVPKYTQFESETYEQKKTIRFD